MSDYGAEAETITTDEAPDELTVEWAFRFSTVLGQVAPGWRTVTMNGNPIPYAPRNEPTSGVRWCAPGRACPGIRGFDAGSQGMWSRIGQRVNGGVDGGRLLVVADDRVDVVARSAARHVAVDRDADVGLLEWSLGLVRFPGRTRLAIHLSPVRTPNADATMAAVVQGVEIEWIVVLDAGVQAMNVQRPGSCSLRRGSDDELIARWEAPVRHEHERVPAEFVDLMDEIRASR